MFFAKFCPKYIAIFLNQLIYLIFKLLCVMRTIIAQVQSKLNYGAKSKWLRLREKKIRESKLDSRSLVLSISLFLRVCFVNFTQQGLLSQAPHTLSFTLAFISSGQAFGSLIQSLYFDNGWPLPFNWSNRYLLFVLTYFALEARGATPNYHTLWLMDDFFFLESLDDAVYVSYHFFLFFLFVGISGAVKRLTDELSRDFNILYRVNIW